MCRIYVISPNCPHMSFTCAFNNHFHKISMRGASRRLTLFFFFSLIYELFCMLCLYLNKFYFKYIKIYIYFKYIKIFKTRQKKKRERERDEGNIKQKQKTLCVLLTSERQNSKDDSQDFQHLVI